MTQQFVLHLARETIYTAVLISAPVLILALVIGLAVGIFQAVTSINEMTLTFIPKIAVMLVAFVLLSPWMMQVLLTYTREIINTISLVAH